MVTLTKKIIIKTARKQEIVLWEIAETCRLLYNHALAERKFLYDTYKYQVTYKEQQNTLPTLKKRFPRYLQVYSKVLQMTLRKVDNAYKSFFGLIKNGDTTTRAPCYRGKNYFFTLCYNQSGFKITQNSITFSHRHPSKVKLQFKTTLDYTKLNIKQIEIFQNKCSTKFYLSMSYEQEEPPFIDNGLYQAFDLGITKHTAVNNKGKFLETIIRRADKYWEKSLRLLQQRKDHCKQGSRRQRLFQQRLISLKRKCANQTKDWQHKQSKKLLQNTKANTIIVGDLAVKQMATGKKRRNKSKFQKSINRGVHNTGHLGRFVELLTYKAKLMGKRIITIDERGTSKTCAFCGHKKSVISLFQRVYQCEKCEIVIDRDQNSAINIMNRFLSTNALCTGSQQFDLAVDNLRSVIAKTKVSSFLSGSIGLVGSPLIY